MNEAAATAAANAPEPLSAAGWIFMILSVGFVWGLAIYCFRQVLKSPEPPPEELEHFRSA
jgi:hypothetical protein